jgi:hypothetical protein
MVDTKFDDACFVTSVTGANSSADGVEGSVEGTVVVAVAVAAV